MKKDQNGFHHIFVPMLIVVLAIIGFTGYRIAKNNNGSVVTMKPNLKISDENACPADNALLNRSPMNYEDLANIEPLGHVYGEHILPTEGDHIYFHTVNGQNSANIYAPGDVTLVGILKTDITSGTNAGQPGPVTVYISPCRDVMFGFLVSKLSPRIEAAIANVKPLEASSGNGSQSLAVANRTYKVSLKLQSGELLGQAINYSTCSGCGATMDFAATDTRTPKLGYIRQNGGGMLENSYDHAVCPLDYFTSDVKTKLYALLEIKNAGANGFPACGTPMQDIAGTAQGNWYQQGQSQNSQIGYLAFGHYNQDPTQAYISAGSNLLPSNDYGAQIFYQPNASGSTNPDPARVKSDGQVYCIEGQLSGSNARGHVNFQLTNDKTIKAEYAAGTCPAAPSLTPSALSYSR